jgi:hypothetical protein
MAEQEEDMIGKLEPAELRELWKNEALDFTSWLAENLDVLKDQLGLDLSIVEQEKSVGPFSVDILAKDAAGRSVIIENQLERTDHDHLGKVLTYLANLDAKVAIWISSDPRPEHVTAVDYLNENVPSDTEFYLVKLQAFRIGGSALAPLFTIEAGPSEERTVAGETKKDLAEKNKKRYEFFQQLLDRCREKTNLFSNISPVGYQNWVNATAGKGGLAWSMVAMGKTSRIDLYFYSLSAETNQKRFEALVAHREEIEKSFGEPLSWDFKASRKQQFVRSVCSIGGLENESKWQDIQIELVDRLIRMDAAFRPWIKQIN